ncbi:MAG: dihydroneopterin aldolase [Micavibrio aeruginosavorus]|uniref:7,8-dihydroneopterin aldolase n=1 Tax=Micavibrio aeruginosavorus TaxID=349221 RepID=A0A2W4ZZ28_9BACT|nr:MAG: dihydroneopterin aldolase [Micavibrio aeruginosavorus]
MSAHSTYRIFIRDMTVDMGIGVLDEEKTRTQRVRINVDAEIESRAPSSRDEIDDTVSYDLIVQIVLRHTSDGHSNLAETLAERIADDCLAYQGIKNITVRVEKPDIYPYAVAGVEIFKSK